MYKTLTLFTLANISREEFEDILQQMDANITPEGVYYADITRDARYVFFSLETGGDLDRSLAQEEEAAREQIISLIGDRPQTIIRMTLNMETGSENIGVDFALLFAERYPCVLRNNWMELFPPEEFVYCAEAGYDGYCLSNTPGIVVKGPPETPEEKNQRLKQARKDRIFGVVGLTRGGATFQIHTSVKISLEEFKQIMHEIGAERTSQLPFHAYLERNKLGVQFDLLGERGFQNKWNQLTEEVKTELVNALGKPVQSILELHTTTPMPSINLALDFMLAFAKRYPCIVLDGSGELHTPEELLEFAQPGYEGYDWNAEHTQVVKALPATGEAHDK